MNRRFTVFHDHNGSVTNPPTQSNKQQTTIKLIKLKPKPTAQSNDRYACAERHLDCPLHPHVVLLLTRPDHLAAGMVRRLLLFQLQLQTDQQSILLTLSLKQLLQLGLSCLVQLSMRSRGVLLPAASKIIKRHESCGTDLGPKLKA